MTLLLVLAGHDPTGGAGVDADRAAARSAGVETLAVVTAWTAQDGRRVSALGAREPAAWAREARAVARVPLAGVKTGLLPGAEHVRAAARLVGELRSASPTPLPVVVDPVLAASGGETFLDEAGVEALLDELVPAGVVLTPNVPELARLTGLRADELAREPERRVGAARTLLERGAAGLVVTGGHGDEDPVLDLVLAPEGPPGWHRHPRVPGPGLHGSGCRHASALAAHLARGASLASAASAAGRALAALLARGTGSAPDA